MDSKLKRLLSQIEKNRHKYWNISPETGHFLNLLIKDRNYKKILEIGTSSGYSGLFIAEALSQTKGHLYTIESHAKERFSLAEKHFKASGLSPYITQIKGHAPEIIPKAPKTLDMAFFDATKYENIDYFLTIAKRIKKGGLVITDNAISHKKELSKYFKYLETLPGWDHQILNLGSGLSIAIKK